ncbi:hypothetical protein K504DRAFT_472534 [Pleomassaria siparia CBS 279.74]|uniref:Uncharacterized protein n=1 Tax=Pleomassaria siparia CBS 279.74 TaxID=1314801 RepID=A0A6G1KJP1_9PLEO|nr:hypothetical protein K504DRAFT_472534 [Pleomassaria siparia CBS 279.74]
MGRAHRMFHRRAAEKPSKILTVIVDVIATVDTNGSVIGLATSTPGLADISVQAVPTIVLPSVPAVPPFPSDLTVPAYPWSSGVPAAEPLASTSIPAPSSSPAPTLIAISESSSAFSSDLSSMLPSTFSFNSTISSTVSPSSLLATQNSSSFTSSSALLSSSQSSSQISYTSSDQPTSTSPSGGGVGAPESTAPAPGASSPANDTETESKESTPLATPQVVASVIGSLAGAALFLAILLFLIRRHKRKLGGAGVTRQITADDAADNQPMAASGQQMATRNSYVPPSTAAFFNRFSGASRSTAETSTTGGGERGFQRISGRKLPSAFSEGMTSEQFSREGKLSGSSFYQDDKGFYGGPGTKETGASSAAGAVAGAVAGERIITMPSPARTPTIHHPPPPFGQNRNGGSLLSPPHSPSPSIAPRSSLGRSHPSQDGSRNSKFTEDV